MTKPARCDTIKLLKNVPITTARRDGDRARGAAEYLGREAGTEMI